MFSARIGFYFWDRLFNVLALSVAKTAFEVSVLASWNYSVLDHQTFRGLFAFSLRRERWPDYEDDGKATILNVSAICWTWKKVWA